LPPCCSRSSALPIHLPLLKLNTTVDPTMDRAIIPTTTRGFTNTPGSVTIEDVGKTENIRANRAHGQQKRLVGGHRYYGGSGTALRMTCVREVHLLHVIFVFVLIDASGSGHITSQPRQLWQRRIIYRSEVRGCAQVTPVVQIQLYYQTSDPEKETAYAHP
jgi:hypothetical protein